MRLNGSFSASQVPIHELAGDVRRSPSLCRLPCVEEETQPVGRTLELRWNVHDPIAALNSARFFLDRTKKAEAQGDRVATEQFLQATVVFSRSVTLHMQKAYRHVPGFDSWYGGKQHELAIDRDMRFLLQTRNFILKEGQPDISAHHARTISDHVGIHDSLQYEVRGPDGTIKQTGSPAGGIGPAASAPSSDSQDSPHVEFFFAESPSWTPHPMYPQSCYLRGRLRSWPIWRTKLEQGFSPSSRSHTRSAAPMPLVAAWSPKSALVTRSASLAATGDEIASV